MRALLWLAVCGVTLAAAPVCAPKVYPPVGRFAATDVLHGPGLLLDGGGEIVPAALRWMHDRMIASTNRGGNVVVLRASGDDYDDALFYREGNFGSVQTLLILPCAQASHLNALAPLVARAGAVYFAGGDQSNYTAWRGSALIAAVKEVYARGGVVGGLSAGLAVQGAVVYDSAAADRLNVETTTSDAVADPLEARISFTTNFFAWPALRNTITDTHFVRRDRFGRLVVFLARILHDNVLGNVQTVYGLGIDQGSAVVVDAKGIATVLNGSGGRGAYLVRARAPVTLIAGKPLRYAVEVSHIVRNGQHFDLLHKMTHEPWYAVEVDGSKRPPYSRNPYDR
jgi:cyanophycinase-like exopeptidase